MDDIVTHLGPDGIGRNPHGPVPLSLPGERPGEAGSPHRQPAPCSHFGQCGGCQLQHADDVFVAGWKTELIRSALAARGLSPPLRPMLTSPPESRRRAVFAARRTKKGIEAGFHAHKSDRIVPIGGCPVLRPDLVAALPKLGDVVRAGASRKGTVRATVAASAGGLDVAVAGGKALDGPLAAVLAELSRGWARLAWSGEVVAEHAAPLQHFGRASVRPPPGAFLQATAEGEAAIVAAVRETVAGAARIADLFAGCGTLSLPLGDGAEVAAFEAEADMVAALETGARRAPGLRPVRAEARDLFRRPLLAGELAGFDAVVLDPPRQGAAAQVAEIATARVPVVAHVSCSPASFARDAATLVAAGYRLGWVQPIDQFRWSAHVELVASFTRA